MPVVTLLQGGRPLDLAVEPGQAPPGGPAVAETPQAVTVALDAGTPAESAAVQSSGPAPFDLADGGAWRIAPWTAPWD